MVVIKLVIVDRKRNTLDSHLTKALEPKTCYHQESEIDSSMYPLFACESSGKDHADYLPQVDKHNCCKEDVSFGRIALDKLAIVHKVQSSVYMLDQADECVDKAKVTVLVFSMDEDSTCDAVYQVEAMQKRPNVGEQGRTYVKVALCRCHLYWTLFVKQFGVIWLNMFLDLAQLVLSTIQRCLFEAQRQGEKEEEDNDLCYVHRIINIV